MGNVLRVLGIVLASMLLGLVGLFLLLFTSCGGLKDADGGAILAVCLLLMAGGIVLIVFLGRGIVASRAPSPGLAVPSAGVAPAYGEPTTTPPSPYMPPAPAASAPPPRPVLALRPFAGSDLQVLVGLRCGLAIIILLSLGSIAFNFASFGRFGTSVATQLILRSILGLLPPAALLLAVSVRNPPAGAALDAVAGYGVASIIFRFGYLAFAGVFTSVYRQPDILSSMLVRLAGFSALEAGIAGLALYLRSRVGPINAATLIVATLAFLFWDGLVQAVMTAMLTMLY
jgi:hypothetical protein